MFYFPFNGLILSHCDKIMRNPQSNPIEKKNIFAFPNLCWKLSFVTIFNAAENLILFEILISNFIV